MLYIMLFFKMHYLMLCLMYYPLDALFDVVFLFRCTTDVLQTYYRNIIDILWMFKIKVLVHVLLLLFVVGVSYTVLLD